MRKSTTLKVLLLLNWYFSIEVSHQSNIVTPSTNNAANYQGDSNLDKNPPSQPINQSGDIFNVFYGERNENSVWSRRRYKRRNEVMYGRKDAEINMVASYSRYIVVKIKGGKERANQILKKHGFVHVLQVFSCDDYYLVGRDKKRSRFKRSNAGKMSLEEDVKRILPQKYFLRYRRDNPEIFIPSNYNNIRPDHEEMDFNDPFYKDQWYLHYNNWHHLNVQTVWKAGYTGQGTRILILDDGIHPDNPDLGDNYDPSISYDYVNFKHIHESSVQLNSHGTSCAGVIAAIANNSLCGVGIAFNAQVGGCIVLDGPMTDVQEAMSLVHAIDKVDIYSASWGPRDDGKHMAKPGILSRRAFYKGVTEGRQGKGSIYIWAAGNGGKYHDNCNMDGYASNIYTIAIGALSHYGRTTYYTETCSATLASTFVGGLHFKPNKEDLIMIKKMIKVTVPGDHGNCRKNFQGTSAAAPMAAGLIALLLEANPELTWRDVQYIIIKSARIPNPKENGWKMNAAGYHYHDIIGFGVMDCGRMIAMAQDWIPVLPQKTLSVMDRKRKYFQGEYTTAVLTVENEDVPDENQVYFLEYVIATLSIKHPFRGSLQIYLTSPSNTVSRLLSNRPNDHSKKGFHKWKFKTVHFWGENPNGEWLLQIEDLYPKKFPESKKFIDFFKLTFYGTSEKSNNKPRFISYCEFKKTYLNKQTLQSISKNERLLSRFSFIQKPSNSNKSIPNKISFNSNNKLKCLD